MKHCYFCNKGTDQVITGWGLPYIKCEDCSTQIQDVLTYFIEKQQVYADIIVHSKEEKFIFTLFLREQYTILAAPGSFTDPISLPGLPINPYNAKHKMKLYLLFS